MSERKWYYRLEGDTPVPIDDMVEWTRFYGTPDQRRVALYEDESVRVSTVWLGLDHGYGDDPPLLWETMVFGGPHDDYCERYSSLDDAKAGHARIVDMVESATQEADHE